MTNYYQCVSCRKTYEQEDCKVTINDQLICPHCLDAVEFAFSVCTADNPEPGLGDDLEEADHWDMIKARVFIILFIIWACFAMWGHYVP